MRAAIPMAALIDDDRARCDVDLVRAEIEDHIGPVHGGDQTALRSRPPASIAHTGRGGVQHQQLGIRILGQLHRMGQNGLAIRLADRALPHDHDRGQRRFHR